MPLQIHAKSFLRYRYYPDYMRGQYEHLVTDIDTVQGIAFRPNQMKRTDYVLDGGNVVHHRHVACTTDKIYRENADVERQDLRRSLGTMLGVKLIVVPTEPYDAIGHADGMLRFIDDRTVVLNDYRDLYPAYHKRLSKVLAQAGLSTIVVPHKPRPTKSDWQSAWGNYVNFLRLGQLILFPTYKIAADKEAEEVLRNVFPDTKVIGVDCRGLSKESGLLNCITWNIRL